MMNKRFFSVLLTLITLLTAIPMTAFADDTDTVYISASDDSEFITDKSGDPMAYTAVTLDELSTVDLSDYGLDYYAYDADLDGTPETTALHLYIYVHTVLLGLDWSEVELTGGAGSAYFAGGLFGFCDENLRYDLNGAYPAVDGWGLTADQIVLKDGDFINVAHYSDWAFWGDSATGFHYFTDTEGKLGHGYTVTEGEGLTLGLVRSYSDWSTGGAAYAEEIGFEVYYGRAYGKAEGKLYTDGSGLVTLNLPEEGEWYVWTDGGYGEYYPDAVVSAPAYARVSVKAGDPVILPEVVSVDNYTVTLNNVNDVKEIRFALGNYTTGDEIRKAEKSLTLDAATVEKYTADGVFTYDLPWVGEYTFWVRGNDGSGNFLYAEVSDITPYVESYGVKLTVKDFGEDYKDMWIAKGSYESYSEIKASGEYKYQASAKKLANYFATHDFTCTVNEPGEYTVLIRYNDGTQDVIHTSLTVDTPVFDVNGLQVTVSNIPDIKIIRTAYGHYTSVADIKNAEGVRNFSNKTVIKDAEEYMIQYREEGEVTLIVEYNNGYKHFHYYNVEKKVPAFTLEGNKVTVGDLDDLYIVRYAPGKYTTANAIKNAEGSRFFKPSDIVNGEIVIDNLTEGRWSFMVQYNDESYNFYLIDVK